MQVEVVATEPQAEEMQEQMTSTPSTTPTPSTPSTPSPPSPTQSSHDQQTKQNSVLATIGERIISVFRCLMQPRMLLLVVLFLNNGYAQLVVSTQVTRQVAEVKNVGLMMALFAVMEVITTVILGKVADWAGHRAIGLVGVLAEIAGCVATCYMNAYQGWTIVIPPILFAIMDTVYQTEVRNIYMNH